MALTVICNNVPRDVVEAWELSEVERKEFDYLDWEALEQGSDSASFFRYRGTVYDLGEFERVSGDTFGYVFDGFQSDTFFSGTVIRYVENCERVIVGRYYS